MTTTKIRQVLARAKIETTGLHVTSPCINPELQSDSSFDSLYLCEEAFAAVFLRPITALLHTFPDGRLIFQAKRVRGKNELPAPEFLMPGSSEIGSVEMLISDPVIIGHVARQFLQSRHIPPPPFEANDLIANLSNAWECIMNEGERAAFAILQKLNLAPDRIVQAASSPMICLPLGLLGNLFGFHWSTVQRALNNDGGPTAAAWLAFGRKVHDQLSQHWQSDLVTPFMGPTIFVDIHDRSKTVEVVLEHESDRGQLYILEAPTWGGGVPLARVLP